MSILSIFATKKGKDECTFVGQTSKGNLASLSDTTKKITGEVPTHIRKGETLSAITDSYFVDFIPKEDCKDILTNGGNIPL